MSDAFTIESKTPMNRQRPTPAEVIRRRYNRLAFVYNLMEWPYEKLHFEGWRSRLRERIAGPRALEVGVGTGKNMFYYPADVSVTAIDFSPRMIARAKRQAAKANITGDLLQMDAQQLGFLDNAFDTVFATFVFCSVPDPVEGLRELRRVCKPGGRLLLLEHMRPSNPVLGVLFDMMNPLIVRIIGANINRRTMKNVETAGWQNIRMENLSSNIVRWIEATP